MLTFDPMTDHAASLQPELAQWLLERGGVLSSLEPLLGDVSQRHYFRLHHATGSSLILAVYPPEIRDVCRRFQTTTELLRNAGIDVPAIIERDCDQGFMLVEDCGTGTLYDFGNEPWAALLPCFRVAVGIAADIAKLPAARIAELNPPLDRELLERELAQTVSEFLIPHGFFGESSAAGSIERAFADLCSLLSQAPMVPCHRDFMARNLVPTHPPTLDPETTIGIRVLDHQDLRLGPPCYDLASLLNDSLFPPPEAEEGLLREACASEEDRMRYHRAAAQRTLKAIGTFAKFARLGKRRHLRLIPETLRRTLRHLDLVPETRAACAAVRCHAEQLLLHWKES